MRRFKIPGANKCPGCGKEIGKDSTTMHIKLHFGKNGKPCEQGRRNPNKVKA